LKDGEIHSHLRVTRITNSYFFIYIIKNLRKISIFKNWEFTLEVQIIP
jgi:hypothetical protein